MKGSCLVIGNNSALKAKLETFFKKQGVDLEILHIEDKTEAFGLLNKQTHLKAILLIEDRPEAIVEFVRKIREKENFLPLIVVNSSMDKEFQKEIMSLDAYLWHKDEKHLEAIPLIVQCAITKHELEKEMREKVNIIAESRRQWMAIFDGITDYIFVTDDQLNIVKVNNSLASSFGMSPKELIGKRCYELFKCDRNPCEHNTAFIPNLPKTYETTFNDKTYQVTIYYFYDRTPLIIHYMKDITEIVKLRKQLYHAEKLTSLGLLVSGVAHEINNPLTGVIAYTELLLMKVKEESLQNELRKILQSAERCKKIVENLLTFSRQKEPVRSLESIEGIIDRAIDLRGYWLRSSNIEIIKDYEPTPSIFVDSQQMQQVILNILLNAEQAIMEGNIKNGRITFSTRYFPEDHKILIRISDNGPGIQEENLSRIFDPFFTTKPVGIGTGLGLSIALGIVVEHGGKIWAENMQNGGAVINIELPVKNIKGYMFEGGAY